MQFFYDGQVRRYVTQVVRVFSNFVVKYGDGSLHRIPVMYGDPDRQVASIIRQNSENVVNSVPRIAVYVSALSLDRSRLSDATFVDKVQIREREINSQTNTYTQGQGKNYTVERLMPTPFDLKLKVDIWSANTEQKLQILEQILVLFNPSLELQTTDNYIDWTSLTVLELDDIQWSSRQVPVGNDTPNEIATLTVHTPIWINPPVKVKHLGVITKIITSMHNNVNIASTYIDGLGQDPLAGQTSFSDLLNQEVTTISNYKIEVYANTVILLGKGSTTIPREPTNEPEPVPINASINWLNVFDLYPGKYVAGSSTIYLIQPDGTSVVGTFAVNPLEPTVLQVNWNPDTLVVNNGIDSNGILDNMVGYNLSTSHRPNSPGTFDAIINPLTYNPYRPTGTEQSDQTINAGLRFLLVEDIGDPSNDTPAPAWGDLVAHANDIIEWSGTEWNVVFNSSQFPDTMIWQTNTYTSVQYMWNGVAWTKSFEGEYNVGKWKIVL
jgi:hypothetical protein